MKTSNAVWLNYFFFLNFSFMTLRRLYKIFQTIKVPQYFYCQRSPSFSPSCRLLFHPSTPRPAPTLHLSYYSSTDPAFLKASVIFPTASSKMSAMAAWTRLILFVIKSYFLMYFSGAWMGAWTFWKAMYMNNGWDESWACKIFSTRWEGNKNEWSGLGDRLCKTNKFLFIFLKPTLNCSILQQLCFYGCEPTRVFERPYKAMCQFLTFQIQIAPAII